ncbi:MAG: DUF2207 domain-containing protein [Candidatus Micrarchaeota archaeon]
MKPFIALSLLLLAPFSLAFTIESYYSEVAILENGDIHVHENITFVLEEQFSEGFRAIRPQDAPSTADVIVHSVRVNGAESESYTQEYEGNTEIVWKTAPAGENRVELDYTLKDKTEKFDDFARVCFEHFGANWDVPAKAFRARTTMPEGARGKEMHFEVYSAKEGTAYVDDLSVVIGLDDVPPGNYVGGCYLFAKDSVYGGKAMEGSAYEILKDERESYGSTSIYGFEPISPYFCCLPFVILLAIIAAAVLLTRKKYPIYSESILPPDEKEEPAAVCALLRNTIDEKNLFAATILDLISRGNIDIVELERKGEQSAEAKRERTVLMLKNGEGAKGHEKVLIGMLFSGGKEVELDELMKKADAVKTKEEAKANPLTAGFENFGAELKKSAEAGGAGEAIKKHNSGMGAVGVLLFVLFAGCLFASGDILESVFYYMEGGDAEGWMIILSLAAFAALALLTVQALAAPSPPKGMEERFGRWYAFQKGLESSRIKEYPPSAALIWGRILVYATALGMADKVKKHLSELDALTRERIEEMDVVRRRSVVFYASGMALGNLSKYGNRSGFSSRSSGGWSSRGGGGFSGGSSGGGGFRR